MFNIEAATLIGWLNAFIVQGLKRAPAIPLVAENTAAIRAVTGVLSFLGSLGAALYTGDVDAINIVAGTIASYLTSFATYKGLIKS